MTRRRALISRAAKVTAGLAAAGAVCGAAFGTLLASAMFALGPGGPSRYDVPLGLVFGGTFGALVGAAGAPLVTWLLLRRVPLGRAIGLTT